MTSAKQLFKDIVSRITIDEELSEKESIARLLLEDVFNLNQKDFLTDKVINADSRQLDLLNSLVKKINNHLPIQQALGCAWFMARKFVVNEHVLIPRPETEELVQLCLEHVSKIRHPKVLDIGTGTGCIPISISLACKDAEVHAMDISSEALKVASANATSLQAQVVFHQLDILNSNLPSSDFDLIVSNPPYITDSEKENMQKQVVDHEPHLALFVPDNDPLVFYRVISKASIVGLKQNGMLAVEINHQFGKEVANLFTSTGFLNAKIIKDISGKDRFVTATKSAML